jgi:hypothetical protein
MGGKKSLLLSDVMAGYDADGSKAKFDLSDAQERFMSSEDEARDYSTYRTLTLKRRLMSSRAYIGPYWAK